MPRGLSPGRTTAATGYAPGELTDSIKNKIAPSEDRCKRKGQRIEDLWRLMERLGDG